MQRCIRIFGVFGAFLGNVVHVACGTADADASDLAVNEDASAPSGARPIPPDATRDEGSPTLTVTTDGTGSGSGSGAMGSPFGAYRLLKYVSNPGPLTLSTEANFASTIIDRIDYARQRGVRLVLMLTGGPHSASEDGNGPLLSIIDGVLQFDRAKWDAKLATFDTPAIKAAIAGGVADGTIVGASVMDEPQVHGKGDGNTWGPEHTMTKEKVDTLCAAVEELFPTLPAGVDHAPLAFEPDESYHVCQFISGGCAGQSVEEVTTCRDAALAIAARDHHAILFGINVLDGGVKDTDGTYDCTGPGQAGIGTFNNNCRMTADWLRDKGKVLGAAGCGLLMWRYDGDFWARSDNQQAFADLAVAMAKVPYKQCRRF